MLIATVIALFIVLTATLLLREQIRTAPTTSIIEAIQSDGSSRENNCRNATLALIKASPTTVRLLGEIEDLCYTEIWDEEMLGNTIIRQRVFISELEQTNIVLWLVVGITCSGVLLAAVQLFTAYSLANAGKAKFDGGGEMTVEEKRMSIRSSVTGVIILFISLLFFIIYVKWVYPVTNADEDGSGSQIGSSSIRSSSSQPQQYGPELRSVSVGKLPQSIQSGATGVSSAPTQPQNSVGLKSPAR